MAARFRIGNRNLWVSALVVTFLGLLMLFGLRSPGAAESQAVPLSFHRQNEIVALVQQRTNVPLVLPTQIPAAYAPDLEKSTRDQTVYQDRLRAYAEVQANDAGYWLTIDYVEDCGGARVCTAGFVSGSVIDDTVPPLDAILKDPDQARNSKICKQFAPQDYQRRPALERVTLQQGIQGIIVPYSCGANFGDTQVIWDVNEHRYTIGLKHGSKADLILIANSAIRNAPSPSP